MIQNMQLNQNEELMDEIGDNHGGAALETPLLKTAFETKDRQKIEIIAKSFEKIMETLGLDLNDDSLKGTPKRVAKMYVNEIFAGLNPDKKPKVTLFENKFKYKEMLVERDISFYSNCEHHFVPIIGKVHVAYISSGKIIGLSKLHRIVKYFAARPQVQERLTQQIGKELQEVLETENVAVIVDADHLCVASRGIKDITSSTLSSFYGGAFENVEKQKEFLTYISLNK
jgi:GTP cyclohydrolase I